MRIVVVTSFDSFASVILALRAGAVDYLSKPVNCRELVDALHGDGPALPAVPETPLGLDRIAWEHTQRIFEQCDRNVTRTAKLLGMHRRTLQRILLKRSPRMRWAEEPTMAANLDTGGARLTSCHSDSQSVLASCSWAA